MIHSVPAPTYGIEEEYFLVDPATRMPCGERSAALIAACRSRFGERVGEEMLRPQIEVSTPILHTPHMALEALGELRGEVGRIAARHGLALLAASTHPLGDWRLQRPQAKPRYERLAADYRIVGRRNLFCGLHVHVGIPVGVDRVRLMNRLLPWLPLFLALSASSPFWNSDATGLASYRQSAYDEWPRSGTPDRFEDEGQYFEFVDLLRRHRIVSGAADMWWTIRPSGRFPTLELRICDACTRIEDTLALAAAFRCLVRAHLREPRTGAQGSAITRRIVDENRWQAKRHGIGARFVEESTGQAVTVADMLRTLRDLVAEDADTLRCETEIARLDAILAEGTSADRQLAIYRRQRERLRSRTQALESVVDWLLDATGDSREGAQRAPVHGGSGVVSA